MIFNNHDYNCNFFESGYYHICKCKSDPHNVPVVRDSGIYYIHSDDIDTYMEYSMIEDPIYAISNIVSAIKEDTIDDIKLVIVGSNSYNDRLIESNVLLELNVKDWSASNAASTINIAIGKMVNTINGHKNPTISSYDKEIERLEKLVSKIDDEIKSIMSKKKKASSVVSFFIATTATHAVSYFSTGVISSIFGKTIEVEMDKRADKKNSNTSFGKVYNKFYEKKEYPSMQQIAKNAIKVNAVKAVFLSAVNAGLLSASAMIDYNNTLKKYKAQTLSLIDNLEHRKKEIQQKEGK